MTVRKMEQLANRDTNHVSKTNKRIQNILQKMGKKPSQKRVMYIINVLSKRCGGSHLIKNLNEKKLFSQVKSIVR